MTGVSMESVRGAASSVQRTFGFGKDQPEKPSSGNTLEKTNNIGHNTVTVAADEAKPRGIASKLGGMASDFASGVGSLARKAAGGVGTFTSGTIDHVIKPIGQCAGKVGEWMWEHKKGIALAIVIITVVIGLSVLTHGAFIPIIIVVGASFGAGYFLGGAISKDPLGDSRKSSAARRTTPPLNSISNPVTFNQINPQSTNQLDTLTITPTIPSTGNANNVQAQSDRQARASNLVNHYPLNNDKLKNDLKTQLNKEDISTLDELFYIFEGYTEDPNLPQMAMDALRLSPPKLEDLIGRLNSIRPQDQNIEALQIWIKDAQKLSKEILLVNTRPSENIVPLKPEELKSKYAEAEKKLFQDRNIDDAMLLYKEIVNQLNIPSQTKTETHFEAVKKLALCYEYKAVDPTLNKIDLEIYKKESFGLYCLLAKQISFPLMQLEGLKAMKEYVELDKAYENGQLITDARKDALVKMLGDTITNFNLNPKNKPQQQPIPVANFPTDTTQQFSNYTGARMNGLPNGKGELVMEIKNAQGMVVSTETHTGVFENGKLVEGRIITGDRIQEGIFSEINNQRKFVGYQGTFETVNGKALFKYGITGEYINGQLDWSKDWVYYANEHGVEGNVGKEPPKDGFPPEVLTRTNITRNGVNLKDQIINQGKANFAHARDLSLDNPLGYGPISNVGAVETAFLNDSTYRDNPNVRVRHYVGHTNGDLPNHMVQTDLFYDEPNKPGAEIFIVGPCNKPANVKTAVRDFLKINPPMEKMFIDLTYSGKPPGLGHGVQACIERVPNSNEVRVTLIDSIGNTLNSYVDQKEAYLQAIKDEIINNIPGANIKVKENTVKLQKLGEDYACLFHQFMIKQHLIEGNVANIQDYITQPPGIGNLKPRTQIPKIYYQMRQNARDHVI